MRYVRPRYFHGDTRARTMALAQEEFEDSQCSVLACRSTTMQATCFWTDRKIPMTVVRSKLHNIGRRRTNSVDRRFIEEQSFLRLSRHSKKLEGYEP